MRDIINICESKTNNLLEAAIPEISPSEARSRGLFGPVYHGTTAIDMILANGFSLDHAESDRANGYPFRPYTPGGNLPAPVHHLGYGIYFTTEKATAKRFNGDSGKGMREFWLDVPNTLEINFASPSNMMKWWYQNGYRPSDDILKRGDTNEWRNQTRALTDNLKSHYDAVWFLGKGIRRLLDGDQICVYDPSRIYVVNPKLASGLEVGAKVVHNQSKNQFRNRNDVYVDSIDNDMRFTGWQGYFRSLDHNGNEISKDKSYPIHLIPPPGMIGTIVEARPIDEKFAHIHGGSKMMYSVKWAKGGIQHNYYANELSPVVSKK